MNNGAPTSADRQTSKLAEELKGSEIIKLAGEIKAKIAAGIPIYNYTIGDFDPAIFPIPEALQERILAAYREGQTNYPTSNGIEELRVSLSDYTKNRQGLEYSPNEFLVAGGARPLIYAAYQAILDRDEKAIFPVPSWNNNHYTTLTHGVQADVHVGAEENFMPTADQLKDHIQEAGILALCSPLNPTGTVFSKEKLTEICRMVLDENKRRAGTRKPLYVIYDQIYWQLCFGENHHYDPVSLVPEMRPYTIYIDGISKAFAATGVRVGWAFGPAVIIDKMKSILGHVGAWAPKPEQKGTAEFMTDGVAVDTFLNHFKEQVHSRLKGFYKGLKAMNAEGLPVDVIAPQAAIYLTVKVDLIGKKMPNGTTIESVSQTTEYLLTEAGLALVPFTAFGAKADNPWYRLSVGTTNEKDIPLVINKLRASIVALS